MGASIWLYLWCLDRMTSISEDGVGTILGGKPITFEQIETELGLKPRTYQRWVSDLREAGYIKTTRTPYGLVIRVNKASKIFGNRSDTPNVADHPKASPAKNGVSQPPYMADQNDKNGGSNKDNTVNNTVDNTSIVTADATTPALKELRYGEWDQKLADWLYKLIAENNPNLPKLKATVKDYEEMNRLHRIGPPNTEGAGVSYKDIGIVIKWCQADDFWRRNILSVAKLRKQFMRLAVEASSQYTKQTAGVIT